MASGKTRKHLAILFALACSYALGIVAADLLMAWFAPSSAAAVAPQSVDRESYARPK